MEEEESEAEILPLGKGTDHSLLELLVEVCLRNHYICFSCNDVATASVEPKTECSGKRDTAPF